MSWDVVLENASPSAPLGPAPDVRAAITAIHPATDWSDPAWGVLEYDEWSIEFNAGDAPILQSIMLHVRGGGDPIPAIVAICKGTGWVAQDLSTGEPLDAADGGRSWTAFQAFRDQIVAATFDGTSLPRSGLTLEGTTLVRSLGARAERRDLTALDDVRFEPALNWVSVGLAAICAGAAVGLKLVIPFAWLGWTCLIVLGGLGVLFAVSARPEALILKSGSETIVYPVIGRPEEIDAFRKRVLDVRAGGPSSVDASLVE